MATRLQRRQGTGTSAAGRKRRNAVSSPRCPMRRGEPEIDARPRQVNRRHQTAARRAPRLGRAAPIAGTRRFSRSLGPMSSLSMPTSWPTAYQAASTDRLRASIRAQTGPLATVVNGTSTGKSLAVERISVDRMMVASARVVSSRAKCSPMHERAPPANGTKCQRSRPSEFSGLNRSGSKTSGRSHKAGSRCRA